MSKQSAIVICPGRGTYGQSELGYLARNHANSTETGVFLEELDAARESLDQISLSALDNSERFQPRVHGTGDNASALIHACAMADFKSIDLGQFDIVAVTGNSMGWYIALACAGVLSDQAGFEVVNTMGTLMHMEGEGGQVIYPLVNAQWQIDPALGRICDETVAALNEQAGTAIHTSIDLGGMRVLAGNANGVKALLANLPPQQDRFPFQLQHHSAFHSPLLNHIPPMAKSSLGSALFKMANLPLIDGRGKIWQPGAYTTSALYDYTFDHQITKTYDFSKALEVSLKEFAPDKLIVLGPGTTLGPPVAQQLIRLKWLGLESKSEFSLRQEQDPFLLSMGISNQRKKVV